MKNTVLRRLGIGMAGVLILAFTVPILDLAAGVVDSHQKGGDLATWIGAVGTVGTLLGTIWLASAGELRRRRELWDMAVVTAASTIERLLFSESVVQQAAAAMHSRIYLFAHSEGDDGLQVHFNRVQVVKDCDSVLAKLRSVQKFEPEELLRLVVLPKRCAAHMAASGARVVTTIIAIDQARINAFYQGKAALEFFQEMCEALEAVKISLNISLVECRKVLADMNVDLSTHGTAAEEAKQADEH